MKATLLNPKVLHLEYDSKKDLNLAAFRISEYTEGNAKAKDQAFNVHDFLDSYLDEEGNLKYFSWFDGHNFSYKQWKQWFNMGEAMSPREQELLQVISESEIDKESGYIIITTEGDAITLRHELSHFYYQDSSEYKRKATEILNSIPESGLKVYQDHLRALNYGESVIHDESIAYLVAFDAEEWAEICPNIHADAFKVQIDQLSKLFDQYNKIKE